VTDKDQHRTSDEITADLRLKDADLQLKTLEQEEKRALARKTLAEALKAEAEAAAYSIDLAKKQENRVMELANDHYHRVYHFVGGVDPKSVEACMDRLTLWSRMDVGCPMEIVMNSPGGGVVAGLSLFDHILNLRREGHKVTITTQGWAASMGGILLQAADVRRMSPESWVLIHQVSGGASGSYGEIADQVEWMKRVQDRILDIFAARAKASAAPKPLTRAVFKRNWERKDWWLSSDECLEYGIIDEIR
jgi:ATP-dependent Clp endopeptidase proteolytic subunit ClpP